MTISAGITTHNGAKWIRECLESVLLQNTPFDEIVICDDASSDNTLDIIDSVLREHSFSGNIKIVKNEHNLGNTKNTIKCYNLCSSEIIVICDQDDVFYPNRNTEILNAYLKNDKAVLTVSDGDVIYDNGLTIESGGTIYNSLGLDISALSNKDSYVDSILRSFVIVGATESLRRDFWLKINNFSQPMPHDMWAGLLAPFYGDVVFINNKLLKYRRTGYNDSSTLKRVSQKRVSRLGYYLKALKQDWHVYFKNIYFFGKYFLMLEPVLQTTEESELLCRYKKMLEFYKFVLGNFYDLKKLEQIRAMRKYKKIFVSIRGKKHFILDKIFVFTRSSESLIKIKKKISGFVLKKRKKAFLKRKYGKSSVSASLFCNNCIGGYIYKRTNSLITSPTTWILMTLEDFVKFCENVEYYLKKHLIQHEMFKEDYIRLGGDGNLIFPCATLGDLNIMFPHCKTFNEAKEKWERRLLRIDYSNFKFIFFLDKCYLPNNKSTEELINRINNIRYKKICLGFFDYNGLNDYSIINCPENLDWFDTTKDGYSLYFEKCLNWKRFLKKK